MNALQVPSNSLPFTRGRVWLGLRIAIPILIGIALVMVGLRTSAGAGAPGPAEIAVEDNFTGAFASLPGRTPDTATSTSDTWSDVSSGSWVVSGTGLVRDVSFSAADHRAVIDTALSSGTVSSDVIWNGGKVGIVGRYLDESNWVAAYFDGDADASPTAGDLVLIQNVAGTVTTLATVSSITWSGGGGSTHTLAMLLNGTSAKVSVDGSQKIATSTSATLASNTKAGLYSNTTSPNFFDKFTASTLGLSADAGPDQTVGFSTLVTLDGTSSKSFSLVDSSLTYVWSQVTGTAVTLSSTTVASPTFTTPAGPGSTEIVLNLAVTDINGTATDTVSVFVAAVSDTPSGTTLVIDTFTDVDNTALASHVPDTATSTWSAVSGTWKIGSNAGLESSGTTLADHRAIISAGFADSTVKADVTWNADKAGLVTRYSNESNWLMAWFDDNTNPASGTGDIVLASLVSDAFTVLGQKIDFAWGTPGTSRTFAITTDGQVITVKVDSTTVISATSSDLLINTGVGLFSRATSTNSFDNFQATALPLKADAGSDQTVVSASGTVALDGSKSASHNIDNSSITFLWSQLSGTSVSLSSTATSTPTFSAPTVTTTTELIFNLQVTDIAGSATDTVSVFVTPVSAAPSGTTLILDTFTDPDNTLLGSHVPDTATSTWTAISGDWKIGTNAGLESSGDTLADHRATITSGAADSTVKADITWVADKAGLVTRYSNESNWLMAWFDDNTNGVSGTGDIVLASLISDTFTVLGEKLDFAWGTPGTTRAFSITTDGQAITVKVDSTTLVSATSSSLILNTGAGLFSRATSTNSFDNFTVSTLPLKADAGPDQTVVSASGTVTLNGSNSASHNIDNPAITSFAWSQVSGTAVSLSSTSTASTTFPAPAVSVTTELVFNLQVSDVAGSATDTVSVFVTPVSSTPSGTTLILDTFSDPDNTPLASHVPDTATSTWSAISGNWKIGTNAGLESSGTTLVDRRAIITAGSADSTVKAEVTWNGDKAGLVTRYLDESNWLMAWFDDAADPASGTGDVVLASLLSDTFTTLGESIGVVWGSPGTPRVMSITAEGQKVTVKLDSSVLISTTFSGLTLNTGVGLFSRATSTNAFDNFTVSTLPLNADAGPDQTVLTDSGTVTLSGSNSVSHNIDDPSLTFVWSQVSGPSVSLSSTSTAGTTFPAPAVSVNTELIFNLQVTDIAGSATDTVSVFVKPVSSAPSGTTLILDTFADVDNALLGSHVPDTATSTWSVASGTWKIGTNTAQESSGLGVLDNRATITAGASDSEVKADITWTVGKAGIVTRYSDESNWIMAWFDDAADPSSGTGDVVLGSLVGGAFTQLGQSSGVVWGSPGTTRSLTLTANGQKLTVKLDTTQLISATSSSLTLNAGVGIFSRATSTNAFDNFTVSTLSLTADAGPDQTVLTSSGDVTLDGSNSKSFSLVNPTITGFVWSQVSGPAVSLSSTSTASTTFPAPAVSVATELVFNLQVTDVAGSATDTVSVFVNPVSAAPSGTTLILDTFADVDSALLGNHVPDTATSTWSVASGNWAISTNKARESSGLDVLDNRAFITAGASDSAVKADITWNSGSAGLVTRYSDESNWIMAWFDDAADPASGTGDIDLGTVVGGTFTLLGQSSGVVWGSPGTTRSLSLAAEGQKLTVKLDASTLISATSSSLVLNTGVGLFSRATSTNAFDNFTVSTLPLRADAGPDQSVLTASGTVTLNGSNSKSFSLVNPAITGFVWSQVSGPAVSLSSTSTAVTTFPAPTVSVKTELVFNLQVTDVAGSATDTVSVFVKPVSATPSGSTLVIDTFTDINNTLLADHVPNTATSTWSAISGTWKIGTNTAQESSGVSGADHRAIIATTSATSTVQADITWNSGKAGLVIRYSDESNWIMAWFDDDANVTSGTGDIVLGSLVGGSFTSIGVFPDFVWGSPGTVHTMTLTANGTALTVKIDTVQKIAATSGALPSSTGVGLFSRATSTNAFDNFSAAIP